MSIDDQRRVTFVDDISPITADILNDLQAVTFDTFSNLKLKVDGGVLRLHSYDGGNPDYSGYVGSPTALVVNGKIRFPDASSDAMAAGIDPEPSVNPDDYHNVYVDIGQDTGVYTNSNLREVAFERVAGNNRRGIARYNTDASGNFENTEMVAGAVARSRQYNAFIFKSIDDNSTPLTIDGINGDKPNLVVDAEVTFKPHDDDEMAAEGHIMVDTAKGGIKTELIVAPDSTDPLAPSDPTVIIGHNVHIPGDITVDGDLIFDTHELGTIGASRWQDLLNADETLPWELSDCTFEHLLPNASHAPINYYPLGTIIELATPSGGFSGPSTWPTGWLLMDDSIRWDMTDDNTVYWLTPLIEYLDGVGSVPADEWSVPGGTTSGGAFEHFIFLGPMSYLTMDSTSGEISVDTEAQERGREWTAIKWL